jgi:DNA repair exonuclease SbcCD ATPase subunit
MKIEYVKFKNVNKFGDEPVTINFNEVKGLILLYGQNGTGKTTISDVITFAIYGRLSTKKKITNIVNRNNQHLETEIGLTVKGRSIIIKRNLSPDLFEIFENNNPIDYAYKKSKQAYLENELIGIPFDIFNNIISLSISDFMSFTKRLTAKDKQTIVDRIFGIEFISNMYALNKDNIANKRNDSKMINKSISELSNVLNETKLKLDNRIKQSEEYIKSQKEEYISIINEVTSSVANLQTSVKDYINEKNTLRDKLNNANIKFSNLENELKDINKKIKLYNNNKCPECASDLTTELHKNHLTELKKSKDFFESKIQEYNTFSATVNKRIKEAQEKIDKINNDINIENNKLFESDIKLKELNNIGVFDDLEKIVSETRDKINNYNEETQKINSEIQVLRIVSDILNENGVKRVLLGRIIPSFNLEIKNILDKLGLNFKVNINDKFVTSITDLGKDVPIDTLSTGQLKKIDIAIILTFIKILKTKFSNLNTLFLDEIFSSVDVEGRYGILTILKELSEKYNINIIVVNHSEMPSELFDFYIHTNIKDNFSHLEVKGVYN